MASLAGVATLGVTEKLPHKNAVVNELPSKHKVVHFGGKNFYHDAGVFYIKSGNLYKVSRAPIGLHTSILPSDHIRIIVDSTPYYYYYGNYYVQMPETNDYEIVAPPKGAEVDSLPEGYEVREIDGMIYYYFEDTYYKAIITDKGEVMYKVV